MFLNLDGLHMHSREIHAHGEHKFCLIKEDAVVVIGECMLAECYSGLLQLPQMTLVAVFINAAMDIAFCVHMAT